MQTDTPSQERDTAEDDIERRMQRLEADIVALRLAKVIAPKLATMMHTAAADGRMEITRLRKELEAAREALDYAQSVLSGYKMASDLQRLSEILSRGTK